jgi:hypothetical protein
MRKSFIKKANYVINTFFNTLGIKPVDYISYGEKGAITIKEGETDYFENYTPYDVNKIRYFIWKGKKLPILFYTLFKEEVDLFYEVEKTKVLPVDIIASSFFFLSGWQEITSPIRDKFGRFPYKESIQYKLNFPTFPIINEYMNIFLDLLRLVEPGITKSPFWPGGKKFVVCLTHDIDEIWRWRRKNYRKEIKDIIRNKFVTFSPDYWVFNKICRIERKRGFSSSFYFLSQSKEYDINNLHFLRLFKKLKANNWEIGIHLTYKKTFEQLLKEKERLEKNSNEKILGARHHWLKFENPVFLDIQQKIGLKYDSSLGFAEHEGYRMGFAFPYYPYDIKRDTPFKVLEIPLNLMDISLIYHQHLNPRELWKRIEHLLSTTLAYEGCLTVLWHETSFTTPTYTRLYIRLLDWIKNNHGIGLSAKQVFEWWTQKR